MNSFRTVKRGTLAAVMDWYSMAGLAEFLWCQGLLEAKPFIPPVSSATRRRVAKVRALERQNHNSKILGYIKTLYDPFVLDIATIHRSHGVQILRPSHAMSGGILTDWRNIRYPSLIYICTRYADKKQIEAIYSNTLSTGQWTERFRYPYLVARCDAEL